MKIDFEEKVLTLTEEAYPQYRSHIGDFTCNNPNDWYRAEATADDGHRYYVWWEITKSDPDAEPEDQCDWYSPSDIDLID